MNPLIKIRARKPSDSIRLKEILSKVYLTAQYPVSGPSVFDEFLNPPENEILHSSTAVLLDSKVGDQETRILGHALLMKASSESLNLASKIHVDRGGSVEDHAVLSRFFVDPDAQTRGVGTELLREAAAWCKNEGKRLTFVVLEKDARAIRMYEREKFEKVGEYTFTSSLGEEYKAFAYLGPEV
jgi:GNAT superfamily N-acetyltransferase